MLASHTIDEMVVFSVSRLGNLYIFNLLFKLNFFMKKDIIFIAIFLFSE